MIGLSSTKSNEIEHRWACHPSNLKDETGKSAVQTPPMWLTTMNFYLTQKINATTNPFSTV